MDENLDSNIIYYSSVKKKRMKMSVLAVKFYGVVLGFDNGFVIHKATDDFLKDGFHSKFILT